MRYRLQLLYCYKSRRRGMIPSHPAYSQTKYVVFCDPDRNNGRAARPVSDGAGASRTCLYNRVSFTMSFKQMQI